MKTGLTALLSLSMLSSAALAAAPSEAQKAEFYTTCVGISQDVALCTCKADAAMQLIDAEFMALVISSMKGKSPPEGSYKAYNDYVARSNQVCKPNY